MSFSGWQGSRRSRRPKAAALAHDIGHPPFGHVAEQKLNQLADDAGWDGFEGNAQSFRIVTKLAQHRIGEDGLNLTKVTLNALLKYPWQRNPSDPRRNSKWGAYDSETAVFEWVREDVPAGRTLEAELMDWADDVTYAVHDMQDFYIVGLIPLDRLAADGAERARFLDSVVDKHGKLKTKFQAAGFRRSDVEKAIEHLFTTLFGLLEPFDGSKLARASLHNVASVLISRYIDAMKIRSKPGPDGSLVDINRAARAEVAVLKELAWFYIINRPSLATVQFGQQRVIEDLHTIYVAAAKDSGSHRLFPRAQRQMLQAASHDLRCVTDFVAGLTEEMAFDLYWRLTGVKKASILDAASLTTR